METRIKKDAFSPDPIEDKLWKYINREPIPRPYKIIELNTVSQEMLSDLKESIALNDGNVDVMIHPYYQAEAGQEAAPPSPEYKKMRDEFIVRSVENRKPLIIFEESKNFNLLSHRINAQKGALYAVSTEPSSPCPAFGDDFRSRQEWPFPAENSWGAILNVFKYLEISNATIGGRYLEINKPKDNFHIQVLEKFKEFVLNKHMQHGKEIVESGMSLDGCVGNAIEYFLLGGIDVSISPISSPSNSLKPLQKD
jgi:hypothetical protein